MFVATVGQREGQEPICRIHQKCKKNCTANVRGALDILLVLMADKIQISIERSEKAGDNEQNEELSS